MQTMMRLHLLPPSASPATLTAAAGSGKTEQFSHRRISFPIRPSSFLTGLRISMPPSMVAPTPLATPNRVSPSPWSSSSSSVVSSRFDQSKKRKQFRPPSRKRLPKIQPGDRIDYRNVSLLTRFVSQQGKILSRRVNRLTLKQQRAITSAIKQARILSLLPFLNNEQQFLRRESGDTDD